MLLNKISLGLKKTPKFWQKDGIIANILFPLSFIYFIFLRLFASKPKMQNLGINIVTIGNPIAGGAGKTPTSICVMKLLQGEFTSLNPCFVSKGYGGSNQSPLLIDLAKHDAEITGDEPQLLAKIAPTIIANTRIEAIKFAKEKGFNFVVTDDGLHDSSFKKLANIAVINGKYGLGNRLLLPAGPLRDRIDISFANVDKIILIGEDENNVIEYIKEKTEKDFEVFNIDVEYVSTHSESQIYAAFCGLANPEKFYNSLSENNLTLAKKIDFPDHHNYSEDDIKFLKSIAEEEKAKLITTEKDLVKLQGDFAEQVECLKIEYSLSKKSKKKLKEDFQSLL